MVVEDTIANVRIDEVRLNPAQDFDVLVSASGQPGSKLRRVMLAKLDDEAPCTSKLRAYPVSLNRVASTELEAGQSFVVSFEGPEARERLVAGGLALDFEVARGKSTACIRAPLLGKEGKEPPALAPRWRGPERLDFGTGLALGSVPIAYRDEGALRPNFTVDVWSGLSKPTYRLGLAIRAHLGAARETGGSDPSTTQRSGGGLGALGAVRLLGNDQVSLHLSAGYDLLFNDDTRGGKAVPGSRYMLHGMRLGPLLTWTLLDGQFGTNALPNREATLTLDFEVPTELWLGVGDAPDATLTTGVMVGTTLSL